MPTRRRSWTNCVASWRRRDHDARAETSCGWHRRLEEIRQDDADHAPH
jgi:hypothetical protein